MVPSAPSAGSAARPGPLQQQPPKARKLTRPAVALMAVVVFQLPDQAGVLGAGLRGAGRAGTANGCPC
jgi:hypothetical protein